MIASVSPNRVPTSGGTLVTITGKRFKEVSSVTFGPSAAASFTVDSEEEIEAVTPPGPEGFAEVKVTTPEGAGRLLLFSFIGPPSISAVSPNKGVIAGGTEVAIAGVHLGEATEVRFGSVPATSFTVSGTELHGTVTAIAPPGSAGQGRHHGQDTGRHERQPSAADGYTYKGNPSVGSVSPGSGPVAGGTLVVVGGSGFALGSATTIDFGKVPATGVNCTSTTCEAVAPPAAKGKPTTVDVVAVAGGKKSKKSAADKFTYG